MAIISAIPGITVTVQVDELPLPEYDHGDAASNDSPHRSASPQIEKYIEAASGKEYAISMAVGQEFRKQGHDVVVEIIIDGQKMGRVVYDSYKSRQALPVDHPEDKSELNQQVATAKEIGQIQVNLYRGRVGDPAKKQWTGEWDADAKSVRDSKAKEISEKALKGDAKNLNTTFGRPSPSGKQESVDFKYLDNSPFGKYIFNYRSRRSLQIMHIVDRPVSPEPAQAGLAGAHAADGYDVDMTVEERAKVAKFLRGLREAGDQGSSGTRSVKRERQLDGESENAGRSGKKARRHGSGEVIDLTDD